MQYPDKNSRIYADVTGAPAAAGSSDVATGATLALTKNVTYRFKVVGDNALRYKVYSGNAPTTGVYLAGSDEIWQTPPENMTLAVIQVDAASVLNVTPMIGPR
jgi:hypothetical protein